MPAKSKAQQRLFSMALAVRKGDLKRSEVYKSVLDIVDSDMTDKEIEDFTVLKENNKHTMRPLFEYIMEVIHNNTILEKFDNATSDIQTIFDKTKFTKKVLDGIENGEIEKFMNELLSIAAGDSVIGDPFIYSNGASYFKIKYDLGDDIERLCKSKDYENFEAKPVRGSKKIHVLYNGNRFAETGSGSIGRVNTESQETGTCVVFNAVVEELRKNPEFKYDFPYIKGLIEDISADFDNAWVASFYKQISGIIGYLRSNGCDPTEYKMERYGGSKMFKDWNLSKVYAQFIGKYTSCFANSVKDNWDPSDVILFRVADEGSISSNFMAWAGELSDEPSAAVVKEKLKKEYYTNNNIIFKGVSLKKISSKKNPEVDIYNVGEGSKVSISGVSEVKEKAGSNLTVFVKGSFDFGNVLDSDIPSEKENEVKLVLRTFGSGQVAIDVTVAQSGNPSLGKCPVSVWRRILDCNESTSIEIAIEKFKHVLDDEKNINRNLELIIRGAIKNGPNCLPFILLH